MSHSSLLPSVESGQGSIASTPIAVLSGVWVSTTGSAIACGAYGYLLWNVITSDVANMHGYLYVEVSYDGGTSWVPIGQAISVTRNLQYSFWSCVVGASHARISYVAVTATIGTCTVWASQTGRAPLQPFPPVVLALREAAVLTGAYVASKTLVVQGLRQLLILSSFTTGATGAADNWSPLYQVSWSDTLTGARWFVLNTRQTAVGMTTIQREEITPNGGVAYVTASTTYEDTLAAVENLPGIARVRVSAYETLAPTNQGSLTLYLVGQG